MRIHRLFPPVAAILALALGLMSITAPSPAHAQDKDGDKMSKPRIEKKIIRVMDDQDEERGGDAGYLGVQVQDLSSALRRAKNIPGSIEGALVSRVEENGPAANAGIKQGDVIIEVNQKSTADASELIDLVGNLEPGSSAKVVVHRAGAKKTLFVTVGSRPDYVPEMRPPERIPPGDWGDRNPEMMRLRQETMSRHRDEMRRQLEDLKDEIVQLRREIRALRSELRGR